MRIDGRWRPSCQNRQPASIWSTWAHARIQLHPSGKLLTVRPPPPHSPPQRGQFAREFDDADRLDVLSEGETIVAAVDHE